jgi:hypothetical protein
MTNPTYDEARCGLCGANCSAHPDAAHPIDYCGDCGVVTCLDCRVEDAASRCSDCAAKFYAEPAPSAAPEPGCGGEFCPGCPLCAPDEPAPAAAVCGDTLSGSGLTCGRPAGHRGWCRPEPVQPARSCPHCRAAGFAATFPYCDECGRWYDDAEPRNEAERVQADKGTCDECGRGDGDARSWVPGCDDAGRRAWCAPCIAQMMECDPSSLPPVRRGLAGDPWSLTVARVKGGR